ncbi:uncharacterized protein PF11_0207-like isoform X1 [Argonauta hians]
MGQGASADITPASASPKPKSKEVVVKTNEEDLKDVDKTGSLRRKAWLKRKPSDQKSPKSKKKGKENKKKGSQDTLSVTTEEPEKEKEEVSHRLSRIELHLEDCQPAPEDDTISLSSCGENIENNLQDVLSEECATDGASSSMDLPDNQTGAATSNSSSLTHDAPVAAIPTENGTGDDNKRNSAHTEKQELPITTKSEVIIKEKGNMEPRGSVENEGHEGANLNELLVSPTEGDLEKVLKETENGGKEAHGDVKEVQKETQEEVKVAQGDMKEMQEEVIILEEEEEVAPGDMKEVEEEVTILQEEKEKVVQDVKEVQEEVAVPQKEEIKVEGKEVVEEEEARSDFQVAQEELNEVKEKIQDKVESPEYVDVVVDSTDETIVAPTVEVTEVCKQDINENLLATEPIQNTTDGQSETAEVNSALHVEQCQIVNNEYQRNPDAHTSPQVIPDITLTNTEVFLTNLPDTECLESKNIPSVSAADDNLVVESTRTNAIKTPDLVTSHLVKCEDNDSHKDQPETETKSEAKILPSDSNTETVNLTEHKNIDDEVEKIITNDLTLETQNSSYEKDETMDCSNNNNPDSLTKHEPVSVAESIIDTPKVFAKNESEFIENSVIQTVIEDSDDDYTAKLMDATTIVRETIPASLVNSNLSSHNSIEIGDTVDVEESEMHLNNKNMSDPDILVETIRTMEETKAKGPRVEILTTDLDADESLGGISVYLATDNNHNVTDTDINNDLISLQNFNVIDSDDSMGEASEQSVVSTTTTTAAATTTTITQHNEVINKTNEFFIDNTTETVFV